MIGTKTRDTLAESMADAHSLAPSSGRPGVLRALLAQRAGVAGLVIVSLVALLALAAPWIAPDDPTRVDAVRRLAPPSADALLGTDNLGRDILSRLLWGARLSLGTAGLAALLILTIGVGLGMIAGFYGGILDDLLMRIVDVLLAFPGILLAIFITAVLGPSLANVVFALAATGWTGYARLVRAQVLSLREREYVQAARALGASNSRILFRHLLPNSLGPILVQATFAIPGAILAEASLSFLGLGAPPGTPSWGALVDQGTQYLLVAPHVAVFPGIALALVVLGFNFLGDAVRDELDPRRVGR